MKDRESLEPVINNRHASLLFGSFIMSKVTQDVRRGFLGCGNGMCKSVWEIIYDSFGIQFVGENDILWNVN